MACPFTAKAEATVKELLQTYPAEVTLVIKHRPLEDRHPQARLAHEATLAAGAQGKFWEMYRLILSHQSDLEAADLRTYAQQLNLDLAQFDLALSHHLFGDAVDRDIAEADRLDVVATPTFFVNGRKMVGAKTLEQFKTVLDSELKGDAAPKPLPLEENSAAVRIRTEGAYFRGPPDAPVEIVEFADVRCPFCARSAPDLRALLRTYPTQIKWVFKSFPLSFHKDSKLAHRALLAAGQQNSFWEMHDLIFAQQGSLSREQLRGMALKLGLDIERFDADLESAQLLAVVDADIAEGTQAGVDGTPTFFINGKPLVGAVPIASLQKAIDTQLKERSRSNLVAASPLIGEKLDPAALGARNAPVTVTWFSDVQSASTPSARMLVQKALAAYPDTVRVVLKQVALDFHPQAQLAHEAALAAGAQGKFWEMYDIILANAKSIDRRDLLSYAARLNIDVERFRKELDGHSYATTLKDDAREAKLSDARGTPVFFVNAKRFDGVPTFRTFSAAIEQELGSREQHAALGGGPGR